MEKQLLGEVNRVREIMGLDILIEQEKKKVDYTKILETPAYQDLIASFQVTPVKEREKFKQEILKELKKANIDENIIRLLIQAMDGLKQEPEVPEEELDALVSGKKTNENINEQFFLNTRKHRYGANSNRWGSWRQLGFGGRVSLVSGKLITTLTGFRITHSNAYNLLDWQGAIDWTIRKGTEDQENNLSNVATTEPTIEMDEWQEFYDKWNPKFIKRITTNGGKKLWKYAWVGTEGMNKKFLKNISQDKREDDESTPDVDESGQSEADLWNEMKPFVITTLETYSEMKRKARRKLKVTITKEREEADVIIGKDIEYPLVTTQFPLDGKKLTADFFVDNHYAPTQKFIESYNEMEAELLKKSAELTPPKGTPKLWLSALDIKTSCSARNNGESPDGNVYTWEELAMKRAEAGRDYIIERLKKIDCLIGDNGSGESTEIALDATGRNKGKKAKDGRDLTGTSGPVWKEEGESTNVADYDEYKFFIPTFAFLMNTSKMKQKEKEDDVVVYAPNLFVRMVSPGRGPWKLDFDWDLVIPGIRWNPLAGVFKLLKGVGRLFKKGKCTDFRRDFETIMDEGM